MNHGTYRSSFLGREGPCRGHGVTLLGYVSLLPTLSYDSILISDRPQQTPLRVAGKTAQSPSSASNLLRTIRFSTSDRSGDRPSVLQGRGASQISYSVSFPLRFPSVCNVSLTLCIESLESLDRRYLSISIHISSTRSTRTRNTGIVNLSSCTPTANLCTSQLNVPSW